MQFLKSIEDKFEALSLRLKIEFFIFPLLVLLLISYFLYDEGKTRGNIEPLQLNTLDINNIKMKDDFVKILKLIEKFALENKIILKSIEKVDNSIEIALSSPLEKRLKFLHFIEKFNSFSKIESIELFEDSLFVQVSFNRFYKKNIEEIKNKKEENKKSKMFLYAVIDDTVLINDKWLKKGDSLDYFKVVDIQSNKVLLEDKFKIITLKLYEDEKY